MASNRRAFFDCPSFGSLTSVVLSSALAVTETTRWELILANYSQLSVVLASVTSLLVATLLGCGVKDQPITKGQAASAIIDGVTSLRAGATTTFAVTTTGLN